MSKKFVLKDREKGEVEMQITKTESHIMTAELLNNELEHVNHSLEILQNRKTELEATLQEVNNILT